MDRNEPLIVEHTLNAPVEKIWKALTNWEDMHQWYFTLEKFKPEKGFQFRFEGSDEGRKFIHHCEVKEAVENEILSYSWRYENYEGDSLVTFELFPEGSRTKVRLTHEGLGSFPDGDRSFARESFEAGWEHIIGTSLKNYVEHEIIRKSVEIETSPARIWDILTDNSYVNQWASAFSAGTTVETDWKEGSRVLWKDSEGNIGADGIVALNDPGLILKVIFPEEENADNQHAMKYSEKYILADRVLRTMLTIEAGPLKPEDAAKHAPLWDDALENIKRLAEG